MKKYLKILLSLFLVVLLQSCSTTTGTVKKPKSVHGDKPLIDTTAIIKKGQKDMDKKVLMVLNLDTSIVREG